MKTTAKDRAEEEERRPVFAMPVARALVYLAAATVLSLAQGVGMNAFGANINQIQGEFGVTTNEAAWLTAAYMASNVSLPLILIKIRTQFGLRAFAECSIVVFVIVSAVHLYVYAFESALILRFIAGIAAAATSSLGFLYAIEPFAVPQKMTWGISIALTNTAIAAPLTRLMSPALLDLGQWHAIYQVELGLALIGLMAVYLLPLTAPPRARVIEKMDLLSYLLIAIGMGCLAIVFTLGRLYWWFEAQWIGVLLAVSAVTLTSAVIIELNRASPLVDIRWLASRRMLHLGGILLLFRLLLSEQTAGAIPFLTALGLSPWQTQPIWIVVLFASLAAGLGCALLIKPGREPVIHALALLLIGLGAYLDSRSTSLTRPEEMLASQMLIAAGGVLFLPPSLAAGMAMALEKGRSYILSFIVLFLSTQSIGGLMGSALLGTFVTMREKFHSSLIVEHVTTINPLVAQRINLLGSVYGKVIQDAAVLKAQGAQILSQQASREAMVLAYNDLFLVTTALCFVALVILSADVMVKALLARPAQSPMSVEAGS